MDTEMNIWKYINGRPMDTGTGVQQKRVWAWQKRVHIIYTIATLATLSMLAHTCEWHLRVNIDSTYGGANLPNADYNHVFQTTTVFNDQLGRNTASLLVVSGRNFLTPTLLTKVPPFDKHRLMGQIWSTPPFRTM